LRTMIVNRYYSRLKWLRKIIQNYLSLHLLN
jgi:hypothetical protein